MFLKKNPKKDFIFHYDAEHDDLIIFVKGEKSKGSIELGNVIVDFSKNKRIVGVQIIGVSEFLEEWLPNKTPREFLKNLTYAYFEIVHPKSNFVILKIALRSKIKNKVMPISMPLFFPEITKKSPALAY